MKSFIDGTKTDRRVAMAAALGSALMVLLILMGTGCTSDQPSNVGFGLVTDHIDSVLVPLTVEAVSRYSALEVEDPEVTMDLQEVLYIGEKNGTRSGSLIANYDFAIEYSSTYPETLFTEENIKSVKFSLIKVDYYSSRKDTLDTGEIIVVQPEDLYYELKALETPFDPAGYTHYPVETPEGVGPLLNSDNLEAKGSSEPFLALYPADVLGWIASREKMGFSLTFGAGSDSGLVGFASLELTHYKELDDVAVGTMVAPNFQVNFEDESILPYLIGPYADTSTFDQVPDAPADVDGGFLLRTGFRSYPALLFDLAGLPPHAFINRAIMSVTNDTSLAFGNLSSLAVIEWDEQRFGDPYLTMDLDDLNDPSDRYSFYVNGQNSVDPAVQTTINFDVTQAILRINNQVYSGTRGFILTGAEDFLPVGAFDAVLPDFYYREFRLMGSAAADPEQRPRLMITYSLVNDLEDGGE